MVQSGTRMVFGVLATLTGAMAMSYTFCWRRFFCIVLLWSRLIELGDAHANLLLSGMNVYCPRQHAIFPVNGVCDGSDAATYPVLSYLSSWRRVTTLTACSAAVVRWCLLCTPFSSRCWAFNFRITFLVILSAWTGPPHRVVSVAPASYLTRQTTGKLDCSLRSSTSAGCILCVCLLHAPPAVGAV